MPSRWIGLQDVEAAHRRDPITFSIPRSDQREALKVGDLVKLIFEADPPSPAGLTAERMWVEVREVHGQAFVGSLDNQPSFISDLQPGAVVRFGPEHVATLHTSPTGLRVPYGQSASVSRDVAENGDFPVNARRLEPTAASSSGWILSGRHGEGRGLVSALVDDLIARFRILDSVLDEPVGTSWRWSSERLEYLRGPAPAEPPAMDKA
jgi:Uncharacterized protein conserved in bacteria (DUF2314)